MQTKQSRRIDRADRTGLTMQIVLTVLNGLLGWAGPADKAH